MRAPRRNADRAGLFAIVLLLLTTPGGPSASPSNAGFDSPAGSCVTKTPRRGCSVFTVAEGGRVFFGGNDDYTEPDSYYWVDPGDAEHYGAIWIGRPDNVQQGVNERGLAYDANGLPRVDVNAHPERPAVSGGYTSYPIHILRECATVAEVVAWVETHRWHPYMHDQMHFADATGDAVILSAGRDGEIAFTRKPPGDGFLVSTNFNVADPANGFGYPCWRYMRASEELARLLERDGSVTVEDAAGVLDDVHLAGVGDWTLESMVADLTHGRVYLYYFHQFDRPVELDVAEEIAHPRPSGPLSELFPEDVRAEAGRRYRDLRATARRCRWLGGGWLLAVLVSAVVLVPPVVRRGVGLRYWIPLVLLLGPIAPVVWLLARPQRETGPGGVALLEAAGGVMPTVVACVAFFVVVITVPALQSAWPVQLALLLGLPLLSGWPVFQGILLVPAVTKERGAFFSRRLPQAWIAANLTLAGVGVVAMPLVNRSLRLCPTQPLSFWTVASWWALVVAGAPIGILVLFLYERWAVAADLRAWSILAGRTARPATPSWRRSWWWIPLSYLILFGCLTASVLLQQLPGP